MTDQVNEAVARERASDPSCTESFTRRLIELAEQADEAMEGAWFGTNHVETSGCESEFISWCSPMTVLRLLREHDLFRQALLATHPARGVVDDAKALADFTEYFVRNYPGPDTIISDPKWHAPRIFRAAQHALQAAQPAVPSVPEGCASCKGSGEVEELTPHVSGDPQDAYMAPATCPVCDGNGGADPWMPVASVLPMTPGWYVGLNHGRVEPLRFDGAYWHHARMTRDLAGPSHWRTFESIATPKDQPAQGVDGA